jgi:hypothetical protein
MLNSREIAGIVAGGGVGFFVGVIIMLYDSNLGAEPGNNVFPVAGTCVGAGLGYLATTK